MHHAVTELAWPSAWPGAPKYMSFSTLSAFESCPLRWALSRAKYDGLWPGDGYPAKINSASIIGQVIHRVIETVSFRARSGAGSEFGSRILTVVRNRGGFTTLIDEALNDVLGQYLGNPRAARLLTQYQSGKLQLPPTVRTKVQSLLRDIAHYPVTSSASSAGFAKSQSQSRKPLSQGLYSEITLYADRFNWYGKVDLVSIAADGASLEFASLPTSNGQPLPRFRLNFPCERSDNQETAPGGGRSPQPYVLPTSWSRHTSFRWRESVRCP